MAGDADTSRIMVKRREFVKAVGAVAGTSVLGTGTALADGSDATVDPNERLIGTWSASPTRPSDDGLSRNGFENQTLREIVHTSIGGSGVRLRLSNAFGEQSVTFDRVTVGVRDSGASVVPETNTTLTFGGDESIFVPAGATVYSDPVELDVEADQDLAVSIYVEDATGPATWHPTALHQTYVSDGDNTDDTGGEAFADPMWSWFFLDGVDVVTDQNKSTIVAFGDSITDGFASTPGEDQTYPDHLARRIADDESVKRSVVNAGISGNRVLHDSLSGFSFGDNALARLDRDVISQPGVTDVILLEGINDIGQYPPEVTAEQIISGLRQIAVRIRAHGINVFAGTLTPTRGNIFSDRYDSPEGEAKRQMVNEFIRTTDVFDGVVDFDAAVRDPDQPDRIRPKYDSGDGLHPNDDGYRAMAEAVDLSFFKGKRKQRNPSMR